MANVIEFPAKYIKTTHLSEKEAVDQIVLGMLSTALPTWVHYGWEFRQLEIIALELRSAMMINIPPDITQPEVDAMVERLVPIWKNMFEEFDPRYL